MADALRVNVCLTGLYMRRNNIGDAGAAQLAASLLVNATLTCLDLENNRVSDTGAVQLLTARRARASPELLINLERNFIEDVSIFLNSAGAGPSNA